MTVKIKEHILDAKIKTEATNFNTKNTFFERLHVS
jgi:hypothetical protein